jgi:salicylate hydroxylase
VLLFHSIIIFIDEKISARAQIEDAAVLGTLFSYITSPDQIPFFLAAYQDIRFVRATSAHEASRLNQRIFHYPDGPEQAARDASMREAMFELRKGGADTTSHAGNANQWADREKNIEVFSYDAEEVAEHWWKDNGSIIRG